VLLVKVGLAPIDENQGIGFPVKLGKIHLLETRWAVVVVLATMHPSSLSNLVCRVPTVVVNLVMRATRSAIISSGMGRDFDGVGGDGVVEVGRGTDDVVEEDRLDCVTRL
jgi:hypothetical protein